MTDVLNLLPSILWNDIWIFIKDFWWAIILFLIIFISVEVLPAIIERRRRDEKYSAIDKIYSDREILQRLKNLKPDEFEEYIAHLFSELGFNTEKVGGAYDGGIDVIAQKDGLKNYIQCKKFITSQVSVGDVRNFYGALVDHLSESKGYFITTNKFTLDAEKFAEDKPIELIDGKHLLEYIRMAKMENYADLNKKEDEKCPECGGKLIERNGKYGKFFGCSNFPKCRFTKK
jgi:Restriction endonuclease